MVININRDFCKGCGFCITFCPKKVYERSGELNKKGYEPPKAARPEDCSECGICDLYCPEFAIVLEKKSADAEAETSGKERTMTTCFHSNPGQASRHPI